MMKSSGDLTLIEVDGVTYKLSKSRAHLVPDLREVHGGKWVVSDYKGAEPRMMSVESQARYADVLVQRKLQELGEIGNQTRVLTHWKQARGKGSTDICFTIVDNDVISPYEDAAFDDEDHHLQFSHNALLYSVLRNMGGGKVTAVLFEHDRHVDFMIGRSGKVLGAGRLSSYAATEEAKSALAESLADELKRMCEEAHAKIDQIIHYGFLVAQAGAEDSDTEASLSGTLQGFGASTNTGSEETGGWAQSTAHSASDVKLDSEWVKVTAERLGCDCNMQKATRLNLDDGGFVMTGLPAVLKHLDTADSSSTMAAKLSYVSTRLAPMMLFLTAVVTLLLFFTGWWFDKEANSIIFDESLEGQLTSSTLPQVEGAVSQYDNGVIGFSEKLASLRDSMDVQQILHDLSAAREDKSIFIDKMSVAFDQQKKPIIKIVGRVMDPFEKANQDYDHFLTALKRVKYVVKAKKFTTDITQIFFNVDLSRE
ncbi:hypothetical protein [Magnetofaba australis]|uniref:Uncharacterized protein n=1 Tax=Magnetofaba australis IT-1 TaxID=1434232 RepID=A0A1Y2K505_9PROT|nr:hypothetical protein [Magnetofaba australis]OSM04405.1 hypothetical protein MAIT1_04315 [Magnetofaba australis IT-1]